MSCIKRDLEEEAIMNAEILSRGKRHSRSREKSGDRSRSPDRPRAGTPDSFISLRAKSVKVRVVDKNLD